MVVCGVGGWGGCLWEDTAEGQHQELFSGETTDGCCWWWFVVVDEIVVSLIRRRLNLILVVGFFWR